MFAEGNIVLEDRGILQEITRELSNEVNTKEVEVELSKRGDTCTTIKEV